MAARLAALRACRALTREAIIPVAEYEPMRAELRKLRVAMRAERRVLVGPYASVSFESAPLVWMQVQEMLRVEQSVGATPEAFEEQVAEELEAYAPLVPHGGNLVATLMFEIDNKRVRDRELGTMGGVESALQLELADVPAPVLAERVQGDEVERFEPGGKTSAVHFLQFPLPPDARAAVRDGAPATLRFAHERYPHAVELSKELVAVLGADVDC